MHHIKKKKFRTIIDKSRKVRFKSKIIPKYLNPSSIPRDSLSELMKYVLENQRC